MSNASKSPRRVASAAMKVARRKLPAYSHPNAPKTYTQWQLFACLVLKDFFAVDYRRIVAFLHDMPEICRTLGLRSDRIPHHTTLQKAMARLLRQPTVRGLLLASVKMTMRSEHASIVIQRAAGDSTGFESGRISPYFVKRRARGQNSKGVKNPLYQTMWFTRFPKLGFICDCATHLVLCVMPARGPCPDVNQLRPLLKGLSSEIEMRRLLLDAGYDSHANHVLLREERKILSYIPAGIGRPTSKPATSSYRRLMQKTLGTEKSRRRVKFGQRWQCETVVSMMKRNQDHAIHARTYWSQCREMMLRAVTHNIMILLSSRDFSTEQDKYIYSLRYTSQ